jgi:predicted PolB exonuclease-like 3'-5' exonuclease
MDLLSLYQLRAAAPLDEIAQLLGLPGKLGMDGSQVWPAFQAGEIAAIRNYCETDAANTYLVFMRFQHMRGALSSEQYEREVEVVRAALSRSPLPHWVQFIAAWRSSRPPLAPAADTGR